ncbi:hypothetical protein B005_4563 [Nocardiopsis alba ATCC BAA-2165]|uniref:Uncharacterized protein n=1 Tax=Nocardiopsis alba (strain ATCC BAA-2165 / BE74) TaxID=1205910 RepID=J7L9L8_NOCAA|nr:hypothetical protein B005_4563 [Nocardiopsis alba ATCC BAA-2165]
MTGSSRFDADSALTVSPGSPRPTRPFPELPRSGRQGTKALRKEALRPRRDEGQ